MVVTTDEELQQLQKIGRIVALALREMTGQARPGITTRELDAIGAAVLREHGARSAPVLVYDFPGATCISVNHEVAHGIPGDRLLATGDIVNIDVSAELNGYYADTGASLVLDPAAPLLNKLCAVSQSALEKAITAAKAGSKLNRIGKAIQREAQNHGFTVIHNLYSHGIGRNLHEEPATIVGFYDPGNTELLANGTVLALEAFVSSGAEQVTETEDGWTLITPDGSYVAQFEHTIVVTKDKPVIITAL
jgi:methionyl aminopeptidase